MKKLMANGRKQGKHINGRRKYMAMIHVVVVNVEVADDVADDVADVAVVIFNDQQNI